MLKKKLKTNFITIIEIFTPKNVTNLPKIWVWDPGVKKAKYPGSESATMRIWRTHQKADH
jgi:hypothetical protein